MPTKKDKRSNNGFKHGLYGTHLYSVWESMKRRCDTESDTNYKHYGGRGISYCSEWKDPKSFVDWAVSNGYKKGLTFDRKNNSLGYSPDNCRFISHAENCQNRRSTKLTPYKVLCMRAAFFLTDLKISDLSKMFDVSWQVANNAINLKSWLNVGEYKQELGK